MQTSQRGQITSTACIMNAAAEKLEAQGHRVLKLHIGAPSTPAPQAAINALAKQAENDIFGYTSAIGIDSLRMRIARHYHEQYGVELDYNRVVITIGASAAFLLSLLTWFDAGQTLALPYPVYGAYRNTTSLMGLNNVPIPTSFDNRFLPTIEDIEKLDCDIHGILLVSPSNPAGSVLTPDELNALIEYCQKKKIKVLSDEIYHGLSYDNHVQIKTALNYTDEAIVINSFSKYYSMPGWRVGWAVVPDYLIDNVSYVMRSLLISPPAPSQYVALATMDCLDELNGHILRYKKNRDILLQELPHAGFDRLIEPQGAFYLYAHVKHLRTGATQFCQDMLNDVHITSAPGSDFDDINGQHFVRFSYAGSTESIIEAAERLKAWHSESA